jgi:hypothetical protein
MKCFPRWRHQAFMYAAISTERTKHAGSNGTTSEVYSKDAQLESRPGNRIFWWHYSWLTIIILGKRVDNLTMTASFRITSISLFIIIQSFDAIYYELLMALLNKLQINKQKFTKPGRQSQFVILLSKKCIKSFEYLTQYRKPTVSFHFTRKQREEAGNGQCLNEIIARRIIRSVQPNQNKIFTVFRGFLTKLQHRKRYRRESH